MPQEAEDLVEDLVFRYLAEQDGLMELQRKYISAAGVLQKMNKTKFNSTIGPTVNNVRLRMNRLVGDTQRYFARGFDDAYLAGGHKIDPTFTIGPLARKQLARLNLDEYLRLRNAAQTTMLDTKRFVEYVYNESPKRRKLLGTRTMYLATRPETTIAKRGIKAVSFKDGKQYRIGDYGSMVVRTNANRAYNMGTIHAATKKGIEFLVVSDGPECGWSYHGDPDQADGKIVSLQEAARFPIAHPNCKRAFSTPTKKDLDKDKRREAREKQAKRAQTKEKAKKVAEITALTAGGLLGAAAVSNITVAGIERFARSAVLEKTIRDIQKLAFSGNVRAQAMARRLNAFRGLFTLDNVEDAIVYAERRVNTTLEFPLTRLARKIETLYPNGPPNAIEAMGNAAHTIHKYAVGFGEVLDVNSIPRNVKRALGVAENATVGKMSDGFQSFYHYAKARVLSEDNIDNARNVIMMEARRRGLFDKTFSAIATRIEGTWSSLGPRFRIDVTDWLRGKVTATPTGLIRTLGVNAAGQLRAVFKMYQDGLIGGHISAIPRQFMNGIIRAVVQIDERGQLVGNLRLIPKGPLRVRLEFNTLRESVNALDFGRIRDLMARQQFGHVITELKELAAQPVNKTTNLATLKRMANSIKLADLPEDKREELRALREYLATLKQADFTVKLPAPLDLRDLTISPTGTLFNIAQRFRDFRFDRMVIELRVLNKSIFDISSNLRIPIDETRAVVRELIRQGKLAAGRTEGTFTGTFQWIVKNPAKVREIFAESDIKGTIFGNVRFSGLRRADIGDSQILRTLKTLNVKFLSKAHLDSQGLQDIATNMRIHGWNIYTIADVLKIRATDVRKMVISGAHRLRDIAEDLGAIDMDDLLPLWRTRTDQVVRIMNRRYQGINRAQAIQQAMQAVRLPKAETNNAQRRALLALTGLKPGDPYGKALRYIHNTLTFLRTHEWIEGNYAQGLLDGITELDIRRAASEISQARVLQVVR